MFDVDAVAFDKDGTLIDLDAAWGPAAHAWVVTAASGDLELERILADDLGLDLATGHLVEGGLFAVGTVGQLYDTTLEALSDHGFGGRRHDDIRPRPGDLSLWRGRRAISWPWGMWPVRSDRSTRPVSG